MNLNVNIDINLDPDTSFPTCVVLYYGLEVRRDCIGTANDINGVKTWRSSCFNATGPSVSVNLNIPLDNEESEQCIYVLHVYALPCCMLDIADCNQTLPELNNTIISSSLYRKITLRKSYSNCRRYYIGGVGPISNLQTFPNIQIEYTPCLETEDALCNNWDYDTNTQLFVYNNPVTLNSIPATVTPSDYNFISDLQNKYIEFCSATVPIVYTNTGSGFQILQPGVDYGIYSVPNSTTYLPNGQVDEYAKRCCHTCFKAAVCNETTQTFMGIYQRCNDGKLYVINTLAGQSTSGCIIAGHAIVGGPINYNSSPLPGFVNIITNEDCNININCRSQEIPNP